MKRILASLALLFTLAMTWLWVGSGPSVPDGLGPAPRDQATPPKDNPASADEGEASRSRLANGETTSSSEPAITKALDTKSFEDYLEEMVTLGVELWKTVDQHDDAQGGADPRASRSAQDIDTEMRNLYAELTRHIPAADEQALIRRSSLGASDAGIPEQVRRKLLNRLIRDGLKERWQQGKALGSHTPTDRLLVTILPMLSQDALIASDLGTDGLVGRPYLGVAQEEQIMDLVELSAEEPFLVEISSSLLLTLWKNMTARGERVAERLASLALLFKDDHNPGRRLAALEYLLTNHAGQYRRLVIELVLASQDAELAEQLAHSAATSLEPELALEVMTSLVGLAGSGLMTPFMILGNKDSQLLGQAYEQRLADDVDPQMRAELITGVGFAGTANSLDLAKTALQYDPDAEVVSRALFVLSAADDVKLAERSLLAALDDPRIAENPTRVGGVVHALQNLAAKGAINSVHRLGRRLSAMPSLLPGDRLELDKILGRSLPGAGKRTR